MPGCSKHIDRTAAEHVVLEILFSQPGIWPVFEDKIHTALVALLVVYEPHIGRWRPEEGDRVALSEASPDTGFELGSGSPEIDVAGDEAATVPCVGRDLILKLRVARCHAGRWVSDR